MIIHSRMFLKGSALLEKTGEADIVVGIMSRNDSGTVRHVAEQAASGLRMYLRDLKAVMVNMDCGSTDGTPEEFQRADIHRAVTFLTLDHGKDHLPPAHLLFKCAEVLNASLVIVLSGASPSITPLWPLRLASPLLEGGCQYVSPLYYENPCHHAMRDFLVFPLFSSLYGVRVRNPFPGDYAVNGKSLPELLNPECEELHITAGAAFPLMRALQMKWDIGESLLGTRKGRQEFFPALERQAEHFTGTFAVLLDRTEKLFSERGAPEAPRQFGEARSEYLPFEGVTAESLWEHFTKGLRNLEHMACEVFSRPSMRAIGELAALPLRLGAFPGKLWAKVASELILAMMERRDGKGPESEKFQAGAASLLTALLCARLMPAVRDSTCHSVEAMEEIVAGGAGEFLEERQPFLERLKSCYFPG
ncbi:MAG: hypothetical protein RDV48_20925 [Candidatus Eremiobacteraeota bacterium]|nr:hypothetical protein [Candidatus Eremiobacteraeota bacterium]